MERNSTGTPVDDMAWAFAVCITPRSPLQKLGMGALRNTRGSSSSEEGNVFLLPAAPTPPPPTIAGLPPCLPVTPGSPLVTVRTSGTDVSVKEAILVSLAFMLLAFSSE